MNRYPAALRIPNVLAADLAGNAFCGPVYAAVLLGLLAALPSKSLASLRTDAELKEAALGALNLARLANVTPVDDDDLDGCEICVSVNVVWAVVYRWRTTDIFRWRRMLFSGMARCIHVS